MKKGFFFIYKAMEKRDYTDYGRWFIFENASVGFCVFYVLLSVWKQFHSSWTKEQKSSTKETIWMRTVSQGVLGIGWKIIRERKQNGKLEVEIKFHRVIICAFSIFSFFFWNCMYKKNKHTHLFRFFYSSISVEFGRFWLVGFCFTSHWGMSSSSNNDNETGRNKIEDEIWKGGPAGSNTHAINTRKFLEIKLTQLLNPLLLFIWKMKDFALCGSKRQTQCIILRGGRADIGRIVCVCVFCCVLDSISEWQTCVASKERARRMGSKEKERRKIEREKRPKYWMNSSRGLAMASHTNSSPICGRMNQKEGNQPHAHSHSVFFLSFVISI